MSYLLDAIREDSRLTGTILDATHRDANLGGFANEQIRVEFRNSFSASIIRGPFTYGGNSGLWEFAVKDFAGNIHYENPVSEGDVLGWLSDMDVLDVLARLAVMDDAAVERYKSRQILDALDEKHEEAHAAVILMFGGKSHNSAENFEIDPSLWPTAQSTLAVLQAAYDARKQHLMDIVEGK